jgi:hypothetical protein
MRKYLVFILPLLALTGCLTDTINGPQAVLRPVLPPSAVYYQSITGTTNVQIRWNPPLADTQNNFKGYFIDIFNSKPSSDVSLTVDSVFGNPIDSMQVLKTDTSWISSGHMVQGGRYTAYVWGVRFPDPKKPDSVVKSQYWGAISFNFDSRKVYAPKELYASSNSSNAVNLFWTPSESDTNIGMAGYIIRYQDTLNNSSHVIFYSRQIKDSSTTQFVRGKYYTTISPIALQGLTTSPFEKEYKYWVKAVRKDSVESDDSIGIVWSGAENLSAQVTSLDTGIFLGISNFTYQILLTNPGSSRFRCTQSGGNFVLTGNANTNNPTFFSTQVDNDSTLDVNFTKGVFRASDFSQNQLTFPAAGKSIVYALFNDGTRARLLFQQSQDTLSHISTTQLQARFQPPEVPQLPFW